METDFFAVYVYFALVAGVTFALLGLTVLFPSHREFPVKFTAYESGIQSETHLLQKRFVLKHYLIALMFLLFDIEILFLYPWAVVAKTVGAFAFFEMAFFLVILLVGFMYVWKKGGLEWE